MSTFRLLALLVLVAQPVAAQDFLRVLDPDRNGIRDPGTIEEAVLSVRPKGLFMEYGLYLTFSAQGSRYASDSTRQLEVEYFFTLPEEAVVTDSWLWVEDEIIKADILDKWSASTIYEDIVGRRRDPSILFKRGQGRYELRIYPMLGSDTRKVKLTFLMPATWTEQTVTAPIPTNLLRSTSRPLSQLPILTWKGRLGQNPQLVEAPGTSFQTTTNAEFGTYDYVKVPGSLLNGGLTFAVDAPLTNGLFVSKMSEGGGGFYQMALLPSQALSVTGSRKVAFAIDYDATRTNVGRQQILDALRSRILASFSAADSFNVFTSRLSVEQASDTWIPADAQSVNATFDALTAERIGTYSSLPALLAQSTSFITSRGSGSLLVLSSSDQFGNSNIANQIIDDLRANAALPPIHAVDFADRNLTSYQFGGQTFVANSYLFLNLTKLSGGTYTATRTSGASFSDGLDTGVDALSGFVSAFDLYTTLDNGFTYGRYGVEQGAEAISADRPILQIGRYFGDFPFVTELSGLYQAQPFSQRYSVSASEATVSDSSLAAMWTGYQIRALERGTQSNDKINEILSFSLNQRVLSLYSAFLALEPAQGGVVCMACVDETTAVGIDDPTEVGDGELHAFPNPFRDAVAISLRLDQPVDASQVTAVVYDLMGRRVRALDLPAGTLQDVTMEWDGRDEAGTPVASGTYLLVVTTPHGRYTLSLVKAG